MYAGGARRQTETNTATAISIAALAALTPTVTCLIGIILQRQDTRDLRGEMIALCYLVHADMLLIHERVAKIEGKDNQ